MTEFNPPIETRETLELIAIANGTLDEWQQEAIDKAKDELKNRGISDEYQKKVVDKWIKEIKQSEIAYQSQLDQNKTESYSTLDMIYIFLVAPFLLVGKWTVGLSLRELKRENYSKKIRQRLLLLIGGIGFWISISVLSFNLSEKKRLENIDKADISAWEKNRYPTDSLTNENNAKDTLKK
jgi:hypothetical protein